MRYLFVLFIHIGWLTTTTAQSYPTGHRTVTYIDAARNNRAVITELFYPADFAGDNVPLSADSAQFPVVVFGHGFVIGYSSYSWLADSLVKNGYIVAFPTTEAGFSPSHEQFGRDIAFLCRHIISLNDSAGSFLHRRVLQRSAAGGHSMGGGASFLSSVYNTAIKAIFNFAAAETNPSAKSAALNANMPALLFAGSRDCIVPDTNQQGMYLNIPYPCKTFVNITDALHCHFADNNGTCATGQFLSGCNNSPINAAAVFEKTIALIVPFLDYYLKDSCNSKAVFDSRLIAMTGITKQSTCNNDPFSCSSAGETFIFTGTGDWTTASNWSNNIIPPSVLPAGSQIIINPSGFTSCLLNINQTISPGARLTVAAGKNLLIQGDLIIQ